MAVDMEAYEEKMEELKKMVAESSNIVFFGGAGVSTESGIPDFRSVDGLYNQQYQYPPETILSHTFYIFSYTKQGKATVIEDIIAIMFPI